MNSTRFNCPFCNYAFDGMVVADNFSFDYPIAPCLCGHCGEISLFFFGVIRKMTPLEVEALKESPIWEETLKPAQRLIKQHLTS